MDLHTRGGLIAGFFVGKRNATFYRIRTGSEVYLLVQHEWALPCSAGVKKRKTSLNCIKNQSGRRITKYKYKTGRGDLSVLDTAEITWHSTSLIRCSNIKPNLIYDLPFICATQFPRTNKPTGYSPRSHTQAIVNLHLIALDHWPDSLQLYLSAGVYLNSISSRSVIGGVPSTPPQPRRLIPKRHY